MAQAKEIFYILSSYFSRIYFCVNWNIYMNVEDAPWNIIVRMPIHWRYFCHTSSCIVTIYDTILQMSEYYLDGKYSIVECRMLILYDAIEGWYVVTGSLYHLSLFLFLSIQNTTNKKVYTDFRLYKPVQIMATKKREFNIRIINIEERWRER